MATMYSSATRVSQDRAPRGPAERSANLNVLTPEGRRQEARFEAPAAQTFFTDWQLPNDQEDHRWRA
jgi:hypothetical protein